MSIFEFLSVAASIVMALSLGTLISSIPYVFHPKRIDWVHASFFILLIIAIILVWWNIWLLHSVADWNILGFAILLGSPISLYLAAFALVSDRPSNVDSWKRYFSDSARWFFLAAIAVMFFGILRAYYLLGTAPTWHAAVLSATLLLGIIFLGRVIHIVLLVAVVAFMAIGLARWYDAEREPHLDSKLSFSLVVPPPNNALHL